ncbi:Holliday junction branch migration protein RuvA [Cohnella cholangitidis]|uniref:Holliday junction branch migration complex subunit RuvA n=1 Tax=Cohnella cholangitidis TaxID=2598458 RepID=A0A7G5C3P4_9BACL|nr:Holliday junction branch migration protein RuvA [Cohnella cholangitidis]QMV43828.1 Holliday junction branch migration protein RuvA [Cohnella cholangitidis]
MIDFLRGKVAHLESEYVVLDVRDVGYRVFTPNPYGLARTNEPVELYIYHHVREDAIHLFGFTTRDEQALFRRLLEVSGIGPKVALGVLAGGRPEAVVAAIQQENLAFLTKLPGIGRKTAQRMVLDLKDKLGTIDSRWAVASMIDMSEPAASDSSSAWTAAREALTGLGYRDAELDKAWLTLKDKVTGEESPDVLIKKALQQLFQG